MTRLVRVNDVIINVDEVQYVHKTYPGRPDAPPQVWVAFINRGNGVKVGGVELRLDHADIDEVYSALTGDLSD